MEGGEIFFFGLSVPIAVTVSPALFRKTKSKYSQCGSVWCVIELPGIRSGGVLLLLERGSGLLLDRLMSGCSDSESSWLCSINQIKSIYRLK